MSEIIEPDQRKASWFIELSVKYSATNPTVY